MSKRSSRFLSLALGLSLMLGILAACGSGTSTGGNTPSAKYTIKIGTDLPTSGQDESSGLPTQDGVQLAIEQMNASKLYPNITFVLDAKDDVGANGAHDPTVGATNVQSLIGDAEVAGIVGPFNSSVAKVEMSITNKAGIAQISPSNTNTCLTQEGDAVGCSGSNDILAQVKPTGKTTYFRVATTDNHQGAAGADFAYTTKGLHTVYVVDDTEVYGVGIAGEFIKEFTKLGGTVLGHDSIASTTNYSAELTKINATKPDLLYFGGNDSTGGIPLRTQMVQYSNLKNTPFAGGDGIQSAAFAAAISDWSAAPVYSTIAVVDTAHSAPAAQFIKDFTKEFGALGSYSAAAYDSAKILMIAAGKAIAGGAKAPANSADTDTANSFRAAVVAQVAKTDYNGIDGHQSFDANGDTTNKTITIYALGKDTTGATNWIYENAVLVK